MQNKTIQKHVKNSKAITINSKIPKELKTVLKKVSNLTRNETNIIKARVKIR